MSTLRTGLIGAGAFGANHAAKLAAAPASAFQGLYDADAARAGALAEQHGARAFASVEALLEACEAVVIATPARTHFTLGQQALAAGLHVLMEKPLATTLPHAEELAATARAAGLHLQTGHQERFVLEAMGLLAAPERPLAVESVREGPFTGRGMDVSVTFDLMIHDLDLAALLFGRAPLRVEGRGSAVHGALLDQVEARLEYPAGEARFIASRVAPARRRLLRARYPSGEVAVDFLARTFENTTSFPLDPDFAAKVPDPLGRGADAFLAAAMEGGSAGASGVAAVALAEAIDRAASAG